MSPESRLLTATGASLLLHLLVMAGGLGAHDAAPLATLTSMTVTLAGGATPAPAHAVAAAAPHRPAVPATDRTPTTDDTAKTADSPATGAADSTPLIEARADVAGLSNPPPPYPLAARRRGMEGRVVLEVQVSADGRCTAARIRESSGYALLDDSARQTVQRWRFVPASRAGIAVDSRVEVPIVFRLRDEITTASSRRFESMGSR